MSISGISASSIAQLTLTTSDTSQSVLKKLTQAVNQGDVDSAKSALSQLEKIQSNLAKASGTTVDSQLTTDMTSLSTALSNDDLDTAKTSLSSVTSDLQTTSSDAMQLANTIIEDQVSLVSQLLGNDSSSDSTSSLLGSSSSSSDWVSELLSSIYSSTSTSSTTTSSSSSTTSSTDSTSSTVDTSA